MGNSALPSSPFSSGQGSPFPPETINSHLLPLSPRKNNNFSEKSEKNSKKYKKNLKNLAFEGSSDELTPLSRKSEIFSKFPIRASSLDSNFSFLNKNLKNEKVEKNHENVVIFPPLKRTFSEKNLEKNEENEIKISRESSRNFMSCEEEENVEKFEKNKEKIERKSKNEVFFSKKNEKKIENLGNFDGEEEEILRISSSPELYENSRESENNFFSELKKNKKIYDLSSEKSRELFLENFEKNNENSNFFSQKKYFPSHSSCIFEINSEKIKSSNFLEKIRKNEEEEIKKIFLPLHCIKSEKILEMNTEKNEKNEKVEKIEKIEKNEKIILSQNSLTVPVSPMEGGRGEERIGKNEKVEKVEKNYEIENNESNETTNEEEGREKSEKLEKFEKSKNYRNNHEEYENSLERTQSTQNIKKDEKIEKIDEKVDEKVEKIEKIDEENEKVDEKVSRNLSSLKIFRTETKIGEEEKEEEVEGLTQKIKKTKSLKTLEIPKKIEKNPEKNPKNLEKITKNSENSEFLSPEPLMDFFHIQEKMAETHKHRPAKKMQKIERALAKHVLRSLDPPSRHLLLSSYLTTEKQRVVWNSSVGIFCLIQKFSKKYGENSEKIEKKSEKMEKNSEKIMENEGKSDFFEKSFFDDSSRGEGGKSSNFFSEKNQKKCGCDGTCLLFSDDLLIKKSNFFGFSDSSCFQGIQEKNCFSGIFNFFKKSEKIEKKEKKIEKVERIPSGDTDNSEQPQLTYIKKDFLRIEKKNEEKEKKIEENTEKNDEILEKIRKNLEVRRNSGIIFLGEGSPIELKKIEKTNCFFWNKFEKKNENNQKTGSEKSGLFLKNSEKIGKNSEKKSDFSSLSSENSEKITEEEAKEKAIKKIIFFTFSQLEGKGEEGREVKKGGRRRGGEKGGGGRKGERLERSDEEEIGKEIFENFDKKSNFEKHAKSERPFASLAGLQKIEKEGNSSSSPSSLPLNFSEVLTTINPEKKLKNDEIIEKNQEKKEDNEGNLKIKILENGKEIQNSQKNKKIEKNFFLEKPAVSHPEWSESIFETSKSKKISDFFENKNLKIPKKSKKFHILDSLEGLPLRPAFCVLPQISKEESDKILKVKSEKHLKNSGKNEEVISFDKVYGFYKEICRYFVCWKEIIVISSIYISRISKKICVRPENWKWISSFSVFLACKIWEDRSPRLRHLLHCFQYLNQRNPNFLGKCLEMDELRILENRFLKVLDFDVLISAEEFSDFYFALILDPFQDFRVHEGGGEGGGGGGGETHSCQSDHCPCTRGEVLIRRGF